LGNVKQGSFVATMFVDVVDGVIIGYRAFDDYGA
jgi:hypothetical protein